MSSAWAPPVPQATGLARFAPFTVGRRTALSARFPGEWLVVPTGGPKLRANDTDHPFRPGSDHYWLSFWFVMVVYFKPYGPWETSKSALLAIKQIRGPFGWPLVALRRPTGLVAVEGLLRQSGRGFSRPRWQRRLRRQRPPPQDDAAGRSPSDPAPPAHQRRPPQVGGA